MKENQTYRIARKTNGPQTLLDSSTLTNITQLAVALKANEVYKFRLLIKEEITEADNGIDLALVGPSGSTLTYGLDSVTPKVSVGAARVAITVGADATPEVDVIEGIIAVGSTAGNLQAQFSLTDVTGAETASILNGSSLEVWQISDTT